MTNGNGVTRRDFLKILGIGAVAMSLPSLAKATEAGYKRYIAVSDMTTHGVDGENGEFVRRCNRPGISKGDVIRRYNSRPTAEWNIIPTQSGRNFTPVMSSVERIYNETTATHLWIIMTFGGFYMEISFSDGRVPGSATSDLPAHFQLIA